MNAGNVGNMMIIHWAIGFRGTLFSDNDWHMDFDGWLLNIKQPTDDREVDESTTDAEMVKT